MIKAIIVDYGGVLIDLPSEPDNLARIAQTIGCKPTELDYAVYGEKNSRWDKAKISQLSEEEHWAEVGRLLSLDDDQIATLRHQLFVEARLRQSFLAYLKSLKSHYQLAILSNAIPAFDEAWHRYGFADTFELMINSAHIGVAKPHAEIFTLTAERLGRTPDECIFVDDQMRNVEAAEAVGLHGILYIDTPTTISAIENLLPASP